MREKCRRGSNNPNNRTYSYDDAGRLTTADFISFGGLASFSYDALGNLTAKIIRGRSVTNSYDTLTNRLTQSAESAGGPDGPMTRAVAYDDRGNITTLGGLSFIYDMADQPRSVSGTNRTGAAVSGGTYAYDGNLKRVKSVINGVTRYNVYDKEGRLAHVDEGADIATSIQTDYLYAAGMTLARIKDGVFTYMHPDHLGSASAGTNEDGSIAFTEFHTPFGEALLNAAANDNQSDFTGHIRDKDIGMSYMQARYMDPNIGRFLSVDPMTMIDNGNPGYFNRYTYTMNDPINGIDPDGRQVVTTEERNLVESGKVDEFYQSRTERGDEYGPVGEEFGKPFEDQSPSVKLGSGRLRLNLATKNIKDGKTEGLSQVEANQQLDAEVGAIRQELAEGYINALDADSSGELNKLSPGQHADYHHEVFEQHGLPRTTFGGTPATGLRAEAYVTDTAINWCPGCD